VFEGDEPLLNEHEVARLLGVRVGVVRSLRRRGRPPRWIRVGQHPRYRLEEIREFIRGDRDEIESSLRV
jgi:hypothetical protein